MPSNIRGRLTKLEALAMDQGMNCGSPSHLSDKALDRALLALLRKGGYQGEALPVCAPSDKTNPYAALLVAVGREVAQ